MKKVLVAMLTLVLTMGMVSCKDKAPADASQTAEAAAEQVKKIESLSLTDLVAKAKAEGANWSVDEWKGAFKNAMLNLKPMLEEIMSLQKAVDEDPTKALEMLGQMQEKQKAFEELEGLIGSLEEAASATANGKLVVDDEEWGKQLMKEIGMPEDL